MEANARLPPPWPPEANGGLGAEPPALGDFYYFSTKIMHFLANLSLNFCFKTYSDNACKG